MISVRVGPDDFEAGALLSGLNRLGTGAVASFTGLVRGDGGLIELFLEHYPAMTEQQLEGLAQAASNRWPLSGVTIIHRTGALSPGDQIVFVGTASAHRASALESCAFLIDKLKTEATFWKRERFADGRSQWVEARETDDESAARWG